MAAPKKHEKSEDKLHLLVPNEEEGKEEEIPKYYSQFNLNCPIDGNGKKWQEKKNKEKNEKKWSLKKNKGDSDAGEGDFCYYTDRDRDEGEGAMKINTGEDGEKGMGYEMEHQNSSKGRGNIHSNQHRRINVMKSRDWVEVSKYFEILSLIVSTLVGILVACVGLINSSALMVVGGLSCVLDDIIILAVLWRLERSLRDRELEEDIGGRLDQKCSALIGFVFIFSAFFFSALSIIELCFKNRAHNVEELRIINTFVATLFAIMACIKFYLYRKVRLYGLQQDAINSVFDSIIALSNVLSDVFGEEGQYWVDPAFVLILSAIMLVYGGYIVLKTPLWWRKQFWTT
eukprot:Nk52_evm18s210 gene=Nk52_evmTU18s210